MSLPMYLAVGDLIVTARLLAFLELMLARKRQVAFNVNLCSELDRDPSRSLDLVVCHCFR